MSAVQLPRDARGQALCRHTQAGRCTWWCSYRRGVLSIGPVVAALSLAGFARWATGDEAVREQVAQAFAAVSLVLAVGVPAVLVANHADERRR